MKSRRIRVRSSHVDDTLTIVVRTLGVQVDDEMFALFEHRRREASTRAGGDVSASNLLRAILRRDLNASANISPFEEGWLEGFRAGYADVMRVTQTAMSDLQREKIIHGELDTERAQAVNG